MIQELDTVILMKNYPDQGLVKGDMGAVVMVHDSGKAFEMEFVTLAGGSSRTPWPWISSGEGQEEENKKK